MADSVSTQTPNYLLHGQPTGHLTEMVDPREREIAELERHCEVGSDTRFTDLFCDSCPAQLTEQMAPRQLAEKAHGLNWQTDVKNQAICEACANRETPSSDEDARADMAYDELKDSL